ncbi:hypothetical protein [Antarctobacter jejuensis]|uniref:hypothetical protein n=1 Tax=Antarctobacter jejuensis TaxID=1439938 RepID=UPI003FD21A19
MEIAFAIVIVCLAAGGMAIGLLFGRNPPRTSCGAAQRIAAARCSDCPLRQATEGEGPQ